MSTLLKVGLVASIVAIGSVLPSQAQSMPGMDMPASPRTPSPRKVTPQSGPAQRDREQSAPARNAPAQIAPAPRSMEPESALSNLRPGPDWPEPVADNEKRTAALFDVLDYRPRAGGDDVRWDIVGWHGGDYQRTWFKTEGQSDTDFKTSYDVDFQLLHGELIRPFYDLQYGVRVQARKSQGRDSTRAFAAVGLQGLAPYRFGVEPTLFISQDGDVSGRFTATKDILFSQRLILQSRLETNFALQEVQRFAIGSGLNNLELGLRLRYELRRELAPYVGASYERSLFRTATLVRRDGGDPEQLLFVAGVRMWY